MNRTCNKDAPDLKAEKRRANDEATAALRKHLMDDDSSEIHGKYPQRYAFPPTRFRWTTNGYEDIVLSTFRLDEDEAKLVEAIKAVEVEGYELHHVGNVGKRPPKSKPKRTWQLNARSGKKSGQKVRPDKISIGHIVVVRDGEFFPWYVGEVVEVGEHNSILICEYGTNRQLEGLKQLGSTIDPVHIRWAARFNGTEMKNGKELNRDEYHFDSASTPSISALYKPHVRAIDLDAIIEYDAPEVIFMKGRKEGCGRCVRKWVVDVIDSNPRVRWNSTVGPTPGLQSEAQDDAPQALQTAALRSQVRGNAPKRRRVEEAR
jgi:hypothetical protein